MIVLGWASHSTEPHTAHAVVEHGASVVTACHGRWPVTDEWHFISGDPDDDPEGCGACLDNIAKPDPVQAGLDELALRVGAMEWDQQDGEG